MKALRDIVKNGDWMSYSRMLPEPDPRDNGVVMNKRRMRNGLGTAQKKYKGWGDQRMQGSVKTADLDSWTGLAIAGLVKMYKRETDVPEAKQDAELVKRIEVAIEYLYRRGRDGRGKRRRTNEPTEPEADELASAATPEPAAEEDV